MAIKVQPRSRHHNTLSISYCTEKEQTVHGPAAPIACSWRGRGAQPSVPSSMPSKLQLPLAKTSPRQPAAATPKTAASNRQPRHLYVPTSIASFPRQAKNYQQIPRRRTISHRRSNTITISTRHQYSDTENTHLPHRFAARDSFNHHLEARTNKRISTLP